MIKLTKGNPPAKLTASFIAAKTKHFKKTQKAVWKYKWLKKSLLKISHSKCAYCECELEVEDSYMEVEHFKDKKDYPDDVLQWDNLLPSCKRCNDNKSDHDVVKEPIINPCVENPKDHLYFYYTFYRSYDQIGWDTVEVLDLNEDPRLIKARNKVMSSLITSISEARIEIKKISSYRERDSFKRRINKILNECQPETTYSALCSSILVENQDFKVIKREMESMSIWTPEHQAKYDKALQISLARDYKRADFVP